MRFIEENTSPKEIERLLKIELAIFYEDNLYYRSFVEPKILSALVETYISNHAKECLSYVSGCKCKAIKNLTWFKNRYILHDENLRLKYSTLSAYNEEILGYSDSQILATDLIDISVLNNMLFFFDFNKENMQDKLYEEAKEFDDDWNFDVAQEKYVAEKDTTALRSNLEYLGSLYNTLQLVDYHYEDFQQNPHNISIDIRIFNSVIESFKNDSVFKFVKYTIPFIETNIRNKLSPSNKIDSDMNLKNLMTCINEIRQKYKHSTYPIIWQDVLTQSNNRANLGLNLRNEVVHNLIQPLYNSDAVLVLICYLTSLNEEVV